MYLESISISGFKSFPHKTIIKYHPGINCIIGPNGCGKSNIIDAIRWALGESRTSLLRAKTMQELIFHGTERRPQKGMAEVSLCFLNDGVLPIKSSEVVISRKLTRSGENEFYLNDKRVLQRDIVELFESINPQGYSLLSREEIDSVLSGDPYYRRRTVEEVAGVVTYRNHKLSTLSKLERMKTDIEKLDNVISEVSAREIELRSAARRAVKYENLKREIGHIKWILLKDMTAQIDKKLETISSLITKEKGLQKKVKDLEKSKASIMGRKKELEERGKEIGNRMVQLEKQESSLKEKRENLKYRLDEILKQRDRIMKDLLKVGKTRKDVDNNYKKILKRIDSKRDEVKLYPEVDETLYEKRDDIIRGIESLKKESASVRENLIITKTIVENNKKRREHIREELDRTEQRKGVAEKELKKTLGLSENLKPPARDMEEIENSIQKLEQERARLLIYVKDVISDEDYVKLGDVITAKKGKEKIVYGALGSVLSCILVNKLEEVVFSDGKRREFICPDLLPGWNFKENYEDLSTFVNLDHNYKYLESILHIFIVTSDIKSAISLRKKGLNLPIVTKNGELLTYLGILEVGEPEIKISKTRLEKELEEVEKKIKEKRKLLDERRTAKITYERKSVTLSLRIKELKVDIKEMDKTLNNLKKELKDDVQVDMKSPEETLLKLTELIREKEKGRDKIESDVAYVNRLIEARKKEELEISKFENESRFLDKELNGYNKNLEELRKNLSSVTEKERGVKQNLDEVTFSYKGVTKELKDLRKETVDFSDIELVGGITDLFEFEKEIERSRNSLYSIREERHSQELEITRLETRTKELESKGVIKPEKSYLIDDINERLENYEKRLQSMQPVNPLAIKEHEEIKQRLTFLQEEREDIIRSQSIIEETIKLLDEQARNKVREAMVKINEKFNDIFQILFQGGEARLLLSDGDPLVANVDIVVSPKGKKLRRIEQLSTGERTLSVIALFFGVYELKPTPFMILDEVDAPLDDANLFRFLSLIKRRAEKTQYILITHNKQTMESANYLYGVTMEEPGVSKIVSVRLRE